MEHDNLKVCKPLSIKLTRLTNSAINEWKNKTKSFERRHSRAQVTTSHRSNRRVLRSKSMLINSVKAVKPAIIESDEELQPEKPATKSSLLNGIISDSDDDETSVVKEKNQMPNAPLLNTYDNDRIVEGKYKRKRRLTSKSSSDNEKSDSIQSQSNPTAGTTHNTKIDLIKELRIISTRLEELDDPHVRKWQSNKKKEESNEQPKAKTPILKTKARIPPKSNSLECTICSAMFESKEQLSEHIYKHTTRELQDAYRAAKDKQREILTSDGDLFVSDEICDSDEKVPAKRNSTQQISTECSSSKRKSNYEALTICPCHSDHVKPHDEAVQIEMVLYCEICQVLFRRRECFETHYRSSSKCNEDRSKGRSPKLFCSTCVIILNELSDMRLHLEEHARINYNGTVNFVCNICRVVFFGVGTVFCGHWLNHTKDISFVASRYSFPKLCISNDGIPPIGCAQNEQFIFVAEFVCRTCKQQFSSEKELETHVAKDCTKDIAPTNPINSPVISDNQKKKISISPKQITPSKPITPVIVQENPVLVFRWICDECNEIFPNQAAFSDHSSNHFRDKGYIVCPTNAEKFRSSLQNSRVAYACSICHAVLTNSENFNKHWLSHSQIVEFICSVCKQKLPTVDLFRAHIAKSCWKSKPDCRICFRQQHTCNLCKSIFSTAEDLTYHCNAKHKMDSTFIITENPPKPSEAVDTQSVFKSAEGTEPNKVTCNNVVPDLLVSCTESPKKNFQDAPLMNMNFEETRKLSNQSDSSCKDATTVNREPTENMTPRSPTLPQTSIVNHSPFSFTTSTGAHISIPSTINPTPATKTDRQSIYKITKSDTCLHGSQVISHENQTLDGGYICHSEFKSVIVENPSNKCQVSNLIPEKGNDSSGMANSVDNIINGPEERVTEGRAKQNDQIVDVEDDDEPEVLEMYSKRGTISKPIDEKSEGTLKIADTSVECHLNVAISKVNKSQDASVVNHSEKVIALEKDNLISIPDVQVEEDHEISNAKPRSPPKQRPFLRVKKFQELQAVKNHICFTCQAAFDKAESLREHFIVHENSRQRNKTLRPPPTMMAALLLPSVNPNNDERPAEIPNGHAGIQSMAGKRLLPYIPQRASNMNARKANPLVSPLRPIEPYNTNQNGHQYSYQGPMLNVSGMLPVSNLSVNCNNQAAISNSMAVSRPIGHLQNFHANSMSALPSRGYRDNSIYHTCNLCSFGTFDRPTMLNHIANDHFSNSQLVQSGNLNPPVTNGFVLKHVYKCSICLNFAFATIEDLSRHMQSAHPNQR